MKNIKLILLVLGTIIFAPLWILIMLGHFITYPIVQNKRKKHKIENKYWNERVYKSDRCQIFFTTSHDLMVSIHHYYDDLNYDDDERKYAKELTIHFGGISIFWKYGHKFLNKTEWSEDSRTKYYGLYCIDRWNGFWDSLWWSGIGMLDLPWRRSKFVGKYIWDKRGNKLIRNDDGYYGSNFIVLFTNMGDEESFEKSKKLSNELKKMGIYSDVYFEHNIEEQNKFVNIRKIPYVASYDTFTKRTILTDMSTNEHDSYDDVSLLMFFQNYKSRYPVFRVDIDTTYINKNNEIQNVPMITWTLVERDYESQLLKWLGIGWLFRKKYVDLEFDCENNGDREFSGLGVNADSSWKGGTYSSSIKINKKTEQELYRLYKLMVGHDKTNNYSLFCIKLNDRIRKFMTKDRLY